MGTWSSSLYGNDTTCDVRDTYVRLLEKQFSNDDAYKQLLESHSDYLKDSDEAPLFWFALAETQWKVGRLKPEVMAEALEWIDKGGGLGRWEESKSGSTGWKKTLEKLRIKLEKEQPKEKRFRKIVIPFQNPWGLNDVYAYRPHVESNSKEERAIFGKYILMQKIGEVQSEYTEDVVMRVQIYDRIFDNMPSHDDALETVSRYRLLPIASTPIGQEESYKRMSFGIPDTFSRENPFSYTPVIMSATMEQYHKTLSYPKDELTFMCTVKGPVNNQHERIDRFGSMPWMWHNFHYQIGGQFAQWQGVEYDVVGDGTFEYPTREQQELIKFKIKNIQEQEQGKGDRLQKPD